MRGPLKDPQSHAWTSIILPTPAQISKVWLAPKQAMQTYKQTKGCPWGHLLQKFLQKGGGGTSVPENPQNAKGCRRVQPSVRYLTEGCTRLQPFVSEPKCRLQTASKCYVFGTLLSSSVCFVLLVWDLQMIRTHPPNTCEMVVRCCGKCARCHSHACDLCCVSHRIAHGDLAILGLSG